MEARRPGVSRIVVAVDGEVTMRAAQSLAVYPGVETVAVLGPAKSPHFPTIDTPAGWDLVIGSERAAKVAAKHELPAAVVGDLHAQPGMSLGSPIGLALALAVGIDALETVAVALPGAPEGESMVVFPSPIDNREATIDIVDGHEVHLARGEGPLAAAMALGARRHRVIVDDFAFLEGIALAAAAVVALEDPADGPTPVWVRAVSYLRVATDMGLVIGERSAVD